MVEQGKPSPSVAQPPHSPEWVLFVQPQHSRRCLALTADTHAAPAMPYVYARPNEEATRMTTPVATSQS